MSHGAKAHLAEGINRRLILTPKICCASGESITAAWSGLCCCCLLFYLVMACPKNCVDSFDVRCWGVNERPSAGIFKANVPIAVCQLHKTGTGFKPLFGHSTCPQRLLDHGQCVWTNAGSPLRKQIG